MLYFDSQFENIRIQYSENAELSNEVNSNVERTPPHIPYSSNRQHIDMTNNNSSNQTNITNDNTNSTDDQVSTVITHTCDQGNNSTSMFVTVLTTVVETTGATNNQSKETIEESNSNELMTDDERDSNLSY